jgi:hypothetical protein
MAEEMNAVQDSMKLLLEMRDKNPNIFRRRIDEKEHGQGVVDPDEGNYEPVALTDSEIAQRNEAKLKALTEDTSEEVSFIQWKNMFYDIGKRLYGMKSGSISDKMLDFEWSQGNTPKEYVMTLGRKLGLEQIADPEEYLK